VASPTIALEPGWLEILRGEFDQPYMRALRDFLVGEKSRGKVIYPKGSEFFAALNETPFDAVKVVILGQDPYHGPGQAHGLCFSVRPGIRPPPSLLNIFREISDDLGVPNDFPSGCLEGWARQGVLLLNSVLTVERARAASHQGKGWERFTDQVVASLAQREQATVFMLWGSYAQKKGSVIDERRHLVLKSSHPSPLSAHRGFLGCRHFSSCNEFLKAHGQVPIDWLKIDNDEDRHDQST
jgi:uracil-DNA glycosylase